MSSSVEQRFENWVRSVIPSSYSFLLRPFILSPVEGLYVLYLEYQSVCPFVRIGPPPSSLACECTPPPGNKRGEGKKSLAGGGAIGANSDDWRESLALCILCKRGEGKKSFGGEGARGANSDDWRESLALCILCTFAQNFFFLLL
jgi:hypothetical protein